MIQSAGHEAQDIRSYRNEDRYELLVRSTVKYFADKSCIDDALSMGTIMREVLRVYPEDYFVPGMTQDEIMALFLDKRLSHLGIGQFVTKMLESIDDKVIVNDLEILEWFFADRSQKTYVNNGTTGDYFAAYSSGIIINNGVAGEESFHQASGVIINHGDVTRMEKGTALFIDTTDFVRARYRGLWLRPKEKLVVFPSAYIFDDIENMLSLRGVQIKKTYDLLKVHLIDVRQVKHMPSGLQDYVDELLRKSPEELTNDGVEKITNTAVSLL